eukprot:CAMPEP_0197828818 /NCGR_PEP_ID=MMETSP1437-20131217/5345_1 /TAXON_ID=49252 ORGANISM="Eucampia antarctica, Strain CCMP1452" /NCGR_SAMPLE_ID=MMETSP1437 /ASSEMBLY_ACC=CAM_ASM_001096 /LENGTH=185 /DNA_ID=CAMNT_0043430213 /DNA_START=1 /DNA_END=558 /DNA_ORIENTATION=-
MGGGLLAFPLYRFVSDKLEWNSLGGPEFSIENVNEAFLSEFFATILLCFTIYALNWQMNFGKYHYWVKQALTAFAIRFLIEVFPTAGPAMNPMLGTAWAIYASGFSEGDNDDLIMKWSSTGTFPKDIEHYFVYWVAPIIGAVMASYMYVLYAGGTFFGTSLPVGPYKGVESASATSSKEKTTKKE